MTNDRGERSNNDSTNTHSPKRRGVLKGIGATAVGLSGIGTVNADEAVERSAKEAGILDEFNDLLSSGRIDKAHNLLEENQVEYARETQSIADQNPDQISTDGYSYDESTATCSLVKKQGDTWLATGIAELKQITFSGRDPVYVDDVCSLTWASSDWSAPVPSKDGVFLDAPDDYWTIDYESYNPDHGPSARTNVNDGSNTISGEPLFQMQTDIEWIGDNPNIPVKFTYRHNGAYNPAWIDSISVAGGSLSVDLSSGASMIWSNPLEALADPSD